MCDRRELRVRRVYEHDGVARIEWKFEDENERKLYLATRRPLSHELAWLGIPIIGLLLLGIAIMSNHGDIVLMTNVVVCSVLGVIELVRRRTTKLKGVQVRFQRGHIYSCEHISWLGSRERRLFLLHARFIRWARWDVDGLLFNWKCILASKVMISYRILGDEGIEVAEEWCRRNGVVIEGVKPLPGSYERPVAHPRGL
jgi:hypothetical protein